MGAVEVVKAKGSVGLQLRLPADLHRRVKAAAGRNEASLNSEIVRRLRDSLGAESLRQIIRDEFNRAREGEQ